MLSYCKTLIRSQIWVILDQDFYKLYFCTVLTKTYPWSLDTLKVQFIWEGISCIEIDAILLTSNQSGVYKVALCYKKQCSLCDSSFEIQGSTTVFFSSKLNQIKPPLLTFGLHGAGWYCLISQDSQCIPRYVLPRLRLLLQYLYVYSFLYRDNGVTIQISKYQFFTELGAFITMMIIGVYNDSLIFQRYQ